LSEKSHKPTQKRLREARRRGEVVRSRELASLGAFVAVWIYLWFAAKYLLGHLTHIAERGIDAAAASTGGTQLAWLPHVQSVVADMLWTLVPLLALSVGGGVLIAALQTQGVFSVVPITPNFSRINPGQGLRNLFSTRNLFELGKMLLKVVLLLGMFTYVLSASLDPLAKAVYAPAGDLLRISAEMSWRLMGYAVLVYAVGAALDYAHQSYEFLKQHKMSIEELRRDYHETEGNPRIKARRRAIAQEAASSGPKDLASANVVVVEATQVAVALYYVAGETPLPRVIAKGADALALRIRLQAEQIGVPVLEDPVLARKLFRDVALDDYIGEDLIDAVAAAFNVAQQVDRRTK
jgi:type III secretion protein U